MRYHGKGVVIGLVFSCMLAAETVVAAGGTVVRLEGSASLNRNGTQTPVREASELQGGDTLSVSAQSKAQIRFEDDSVLAVPGAARLRIDEFRMPSARNEGRAIYTLQAGGFRAITGAIGKGRKDVHELRTAMATVNVGDSVYSGILCERQCDAQFKRGLYVLSEDGVITVSNAKGTLRLRKGQVAYVSTDSAAPVSVRVSPFSDPQFASGYGVEVEFDTQVHPPRIEQEQPASPS